MILIIFLTKVSIKYKNITKYQYQAPCHHYHRYPRPPPQPPAPQSPSRPGRAAPHPSRPSPHRRSTRTGDARGHCQAPDVLSSLRNGTAEEIAGPGSDGGNATALLGLSGSGDWSLVTGTDLCLLRSAIPENSDQS